jgi:hypothetical protein
MPFGIIRGIELLGLVGYELWHKHHYGTWGFGDPNKKNNNNNYNYNQGYGYGRYATPYGYAPNGFSGGYGPYY